MNKPKIGKDFGKNSKNVISHFDEMKMEDKFKFKELIEAGETYKFTDCSKIEFEVTKELVKGFKEKEVNVVEEKFVPYVIEPSFGIGRIIFALLEHSYMVRDGKEILKLNVNMAPVKVSLIPLFTKQEFMSYIPQIDKKLKQAGLSCKVDRSGVAIGRKYARNDEIGVPYAITIDHTTFEDNTITLREIVTTEQVRIPINEVAEVLSRLVNNFTVWQEILQKYPKLVAETKDEKK